MIEAEQDFDGLMQRVRDGCPDAAREMFDRYSPHIRRVVRRHLHQKLRPQYDSIDFLQAVWASFFLTPPDRFNFASAEALIGFLGQVATHKVTDAFRRGLRTQKNNLNRVCSLTDAADELEKTPAVHQPTPSQFAMANERWEQLIADQPPQFRLVLELLREGCSYREIAEKSGLHPKAVQRLLRRLYDRGSLS